MNDHRSSLLDVRAAEAFMAAHAASAANIPLEQLPHRVHELPPPGTIIKVIDEQPDRAQSAAEFLRGRGYDASIVASPPHDRSGPATAYLWRPSDFLIESAQAIAETEKLDFCQWCDGKSAADLACGSGREAVWLAMAGMTIDAIDHLPDALTRAQNLARHCGVGERLSTRQIDLRAGHLPGEYDLICIFRYLHRPLLPQLKSSLKPGGYLIYETFHHRTALTGRSPRSPEHLLLDGELGRALADLHIMVNRDGVERDGRYFSQMLAKKN